MRKTSLSLVLVSVFLAGTVLLGQSVPSAVGDAPKAGKLVLTVDSIMRGPDLVGYPPDGLRWSADSQKLYFEWRKPGEDEASTYVVGRDGRPPTDDGTRLGSVSSSRIAATS